MTVYGATKTGFRKKTYEEILESLRMRARKPEYYGPNADISPYSPLGIHIELQENELASAWDGLEENYNGAYIDTAIGVALDRAVKLTGTTRQGKVRYSTMLRISGEDWTVVQSGFRAKTASGIEYRTVEDATIRDGVAETTAEAVEYGFVNAVLAGQITQITTPVVGVYGVTNITDAIGGNPTEPDHELRARGIERASLNTKDVGALTEMRIMIEADASVRTCRIIENELPVSVDGLLPNSLMFIVDGGSDSHVAGLIYKYKQGGTPLNGNISVNIVDDAGNPHVIRFSRPATIPLYISVAITKKDGWMPDNVREIARRLIETIGGTDTYTMNGESVSVDYSGIKAGEDVLPLPLYAALNGLPGIANATILLGRIGDDVTHVSLIMAPNEIARVYTANITVE